MSAAVSYLQISSLVLPTVLPVALLTIGSLAGGGLVSGVVLGSIMIVTSGTVGTLMHVGCGERHHKWKMFASTIGIALFIIGAMTIAGRFPVATVGWSAAGIAGSSIVIFLSSLAFRFSLNDN